MLFALGVGSQVVGDVSQTQFPPEAAKLPKVGGYATPDLEKVIALHPNLVVTLQEASSPKIIEPLERAGIKVAVFKTDRLADLFQTVEALGAAVGQADSGRALASRLKQEIQAASYRPPQHSAILRPRVLLLVQKRPFMVVSGHTFLGELVELAGGENPFARARLAYPTVGMEMILSARPDVILDFCMMSGWSEKSAQADVFWQNFSMLPAVANKTIYSLAIEDFLAGPRIAKALRRLVELIHGHDN